MYRHTKGTRHAPNLEDADEGCHDLGVGNAGDDLTRRRGDGTPTYTERALNPPEGAFDGQTTHDYGPLPPVQLFTARVTVTDDSTTREGANAAAHHPTRSVRPARLFWTNTVDTRERGV